MRTQKLNRAAAIAVVAVTLSAATAIHAAREQERVGKKAESIVIEPRVAPEPVPPPPPRRGFNVDIWTDQQTYRVGDLVRIYFRVTRPCYVYIFNTDTEGLTHQLFPSYYDRDNYVVPGGRYFIPDARYRLRVTGPPGTEHLRIVAVRYRALRYERRHRFSPNEPFPLYPEGAKGFLREYQREEHRPESGRPRGRREASRSLGEGEAMAGRRPEAIVVEPADRRADSPRTIVVERPDSAYDREWVEAYTTVRVVDPYPRPIPVYHGRLEVISHPSRARVYVDDRYRGRAPLTVRLLEPGVHSVEVSLPGYHTWERGVEVREGRTVIVDVRLRRRHSRFFFEFRF